MNGCVVGRVVLDIVGINDRAKVDWVISRGLEDAFVRWLEGLRVLAEGGVRDDVVGNMFWSYCARFGVCVWSVHD